MSSSETRSIALAFQTLGVVHGSHGCLMCAKNARSFVEKLSLTESDTQ